MDNTEIYLFHYFNKSGKIPVVFHVEHISHNHPGALKAITLISIETDFVMSIQTGKVRGGMRI